MLFKYIKINELHFIINLGWGIIRHLFFYPIITYDLFTFSNLHFSLNTHLCTFMYVRKCYSNTLKINELQTLILN